MEDFQSDFSQCSAKIYTSDNQPWICKVIKEGIKLKENAYKVAKISGKLEDWEIFKGQQKATKKAMKKSKMDYESKLARI